MSDSVKIKYKIFTKGCISKCESILNLKKIPEKAVDRRLKAILDLWLFSWIKKAELLARLNLDKNVTPNLLTTAQHAVSVVAHPL